MNENGFDTEQNIENQSPPFNKNYKKKFNKKSLIIPLIAILIILFKDVMLQLLGVILLVICVGVVIIKAIKYIVSFGGCLLNIIISILAFVFILSAMGWVIELFS